MSLWKIAALSDYIIPTHCTGFEDHRNVRP